jgi:hypothetical protein
MPLDFFGLLAVILGIIYTIRKLDVRRREPGEFPQVLRADFERWQKKELFCYNLASVACFLKVLIDIALQFQHVIPWNTVRILGATTFIAWAGALVASLLLGSAARKLRAELGIDLGAHASPPPT